AFECTWIDDVRQAEDAGREAIRLRNEVGDPSATAMAMVRLSQNLLQQGRNRESDEMTEATFKLLESVPAGPAHAYARSHRAYMLMLDRRTEEAIVEGEAAIELARRFNDATSLTNAYNAVGSSLILLGHYREGERRL